MDMQFDLRNSAYHITPTSQNGWGRGGMTLVLVPCSWSAHDQNVLVRRAHSRINQAPL